MKKILSIFAVTLMVATVFTGCKKGEDDPMISFNSRVKRISGLWNLTGKNATITQSVVVGPVSVNTTITGVLTGTNETVTITADSVTTLQRPYNVNITFNENGSFDYALSVQVPGALPSDPQKTYVFEGSGDWSWVDSGKDKLGLDLMTDYDPPVPDSLNPGTFFPYQIGGSYYILQLSSDQMVLTQKGNLTTNIDTTVTILGYDNKFTFTR